MWLYIFVAGGLVIALALVAFIATLTARYFFVDRFPDEVHYATTEDGWRLGVVRYRGTGEPVLLIHGLAANARTFDLTDNLSLAKYLVAKGYDVWLAELRGRGLSSRPRLFSRHSHNWSFDEYAERDLPAIAETVLRATGHKRFHLVGFSSGALASYAWLSDPHRTAQVASFVSMAGPATFKRLGRQVSGRILRSLRFFRHRFLMRMLASLSGYWHPTPIQIIWNPENLDGATLRRAMVNMIANFSRNELLQYSDWLLHDVFRSIDHRRDYRAEMSRIVVPTLFLAGGRDVIGSPDAVKDAYELVGATDKKFITLARSQGFKVNYGHADLSIGKHASEEVFPLIVDWIQNHATAEQPRRRAGEKIEDRVSEQLPAIKAVD